MDKNISSELKELLENAQYEAVILDDFINALEKTLKEKADLILLW